MAKPYFQTLCHKCTIFFKDIEYKYRVSVSLQSLSESFIVKRTEPHIIINVQKSSCKVTVNLTVF